MAAIEAGTIGNTTGTRMPARRMTHAGRGGGEELSTTTPLSSLLAAAMAAVFNYYSYDVRLDGQRRRDLDHHKFHIFSRAVRDSGLLDSTTSFADLEVTTL